MIEVRIEDKPKFTVMGRQAWMPIHESGGFEKLLKDAHESSLIKKLMDFNQGEAGTETKADFLGIAVTPAEGDMIYYIAGEVPADAQDSSMESFIVPASRWAILKSQGDSIQEISELEQYGYGDWLLKSGYKLTEAPQMNVFLHDGERKYSELWLPIVKKEETQNLKIRPYLTFNGECSEAIELYKKAFQTDTLQVMRFSDMPPNPAYPIAAEYKDRILQATMQFGDEYIRMSDCGPMQPLNAPESERISLAIEASVEQVTSAFEILSQDGRVGMALEKTFYSPCAGVVFDKFGVMWNFSAL
jgi:PhnB protein